MGTVVDEYRTLRGLTYPEVLTALGATADLFLANYSGLAKMPMPADQRRRLSEEQTFEIYYRASKGESKYRVAKSLGFSMSTVSRLIGGDNRPGRKPTPFAQRLESDDQLMLRYELWVKRRELELNPDVEAAKR